MNAITQSRWFQLMLAITLAIGLFFMYTSSVAAQTESRSDQTTTESEDDVRANDADSDDDGLDDGTESANYNNSRSNRSTVTGPDTNVCDGVTCSDGSCAATADECSALEVEVEANYNNSRSNRANVAPDTDTDGRADVSSQPDYNDPDDDGDGVPTRTDGSDSEVNDRNESNLEFVRTRANITKEIDKASPKIQRLRGLDKSTPLLYQSIRTSGALCPTDDCDDGDDEVRPGEEERRQHALRVNISGEEVRGASDEAKAEVRQRLQENDEINDANDFGISVALAALDNESITEIDTDDEQTTIRYRTPARLFGFIPADIRARVEATAEGQEVRYPWFAFLATKEDQPNLRELAAEIRANHDSILSAAVEESDEE